MLTPLALFLGLLVATAFIAHWSDNLGKKLGKKRVSVFGLRPRTSATLLTVVSSWAIMGFTLVALLLAVAPLRQALFRYDEERSRFSGEKSRFDTEQNRFTVERARFESERVHFIKEQHTSQQRLSASQGQQQKAESQTHLAKAQTRVARVQAVSFQSEARKYQSEARVSQSEADKARRDFKVARNGEQNARALAQAAKQQRQEAIADLTSVKTQLNSSTSQLSQAERNVKRTGFNLKQKQAQLKQAEARTKQAQAQRKQAEQGASRANQAASRAEQAAFRVGKQILALTSQKQALERSNHEAQQVALRYGQLADNLAVVATSAISLRVEQTLAERRIDTNSSPAQIANELRFLVDASQNAVQQFVPGAKVVARAFDSDPKTGEAIELSQQQTLERYARLLFETRQSFSVRLVSALNYPRDASQVLARFFLVPVRKIYTAQQTIGEATIDTTKNESAIFRQLEDLVELARFNAVKRGSSPPLSPDSLNFFDGDTGQKMLDTLRKLQRLSRPASVRIVAARDLDATEPLQIRFQISDSGAV